MLHEAHLSTPRMLVKGRETTWTCRRSCASHSCGHCLSMKRQRSRHAGCVTRHPGQSARSGPWAAPVLRNTSRSHLTCSRGLRSSHLDDHKVWAPSRSHSCVCVCVLTLTPITRRPGWHSSLRGPPLHCRDQALPLHFTSGWIGVRKWCTQQGTHRSRSEMN